MNSAHSAEYSLFTSNWISSRSDEELIMHYLHYHHLYQIIQYTLLFTTQSSTAGYIGLYSINNE